MDPTLSPNFSSHTALLSVQRNYSAHCGLQSTNNISADDLYPGSSQNYPHAMSSHHQPIATHNHWRPQTFVSWEAPAGPHCNGPQGQSNSAILYSAEAYSNEDPSRQFDAAPAVHNNYLDHRYKSNKHKSILTFQRRIIFSNNVQDGDPWFV